MTPALRAAFFSFLAFTAYFIAGSLISDSMRFPYGYVSIGALVLFFCTGYYIARHYRLHSAAVATGLAAFLASVAAWIILGIVNPLRVPTPRPQASAMGEVVVLMTVAALLVGGLGAWVAGRSPARQASA